MPTLWEPAQVDVLLRYRQQQKIRNTRLIITLQKLQEKSLAFYNIFKDQRRKSVQSDRNKPPASSPSSNRITTGTPLHSSFFIPPGSPFFLTPSDFFFTSLITFSTRQPHSLTFPPLLLPPLLLTLTHFQSCQHVSCHLLRADTK